MNQFELDKLIENFDLINFLDENNIDYAEEVKNVGPDWIGIGLCPFCGDSRYHLAINRHNKNFNCWVCSQKGNLIKFIKEILNISWSEAYKIINDGNSTEYTSEDLEDTVRKIICNKKEVEVITKNPKKIELPDSRIITKEILKKNKHLNFLFKTKKLTLNHVKKYDLSLGTDEKSSNQLIIPIYNNSKLVAYQQRALNRKKYKNLGLIKSYLYNYETLLKNEVIVIVEGFFDYVTTREFLNKYRPSYHVTTPFSKILSDEQITLVNNLKPKLVIFFLDNDAWFEYSKYHHNIFYPVTFLICPNGKDPNSISQEQLLKIFEKNNL